MIEEKTIIFLIRSGLVFLCGVGVVRGFLEGLVFSNPASVDLGFAAWLSAK